MISQEEISIKNDILEQIQNEKVRMKPRFVFMMQVILLGIIATFFIILSIFMLSLVFFDMRESGREAFLGYGPQGVRHFLLVLPWVFILFDIALILLAVWLIRRFRFGYRSSILFLIGSLVVAVSALGVLIDQKTELHEGLRRVNKNYPLPVIGGYYSDLDNPSYMRGICNCVVTKISDNTLTVTDNDGDADTDHSFTIILPDSTATSTFHIGDRLSIVGEWNGSTTITAYGIKNELATSSLGY